MKGKYSIGMVYLVYRYMKQLMEYSITIYGVILDLNRRSVYLNRLEQFMNSSSDKKDIGFVFQEKIRTIEYRDVSFQYQVNHSKVKNVIDKWNYSINEGESTAFVGRSESGKSTLLQLLMKLYEPNSGNIYINGIALKQIDIKSWLAKLAVVMQEPYIFHDTIRNNIIMNQEAISDEYIIEVCKLVCIWNFIKNKSGGLDYCLEAKGKNISGGQMQRIALARALIRDPQILILDEATSALDVETERNVLNKILKYREGKTTLMIAHRKEVIEKNKNIVSLT